MGIHEAMQRAPDEVRIIAGNRRVPRTAHRCERHAETAQREQAHDLLARLLITERFVHQHGADIKEQPPQPREAVLNRARVP